MGASTPHMITTVFNGSTGSRVCHMIAAQNHDAITVSTTVAFFAVNGDTEVPDSRNSVMVAIDQPDNVPMTIDDTSGQFTPTPSNHSISFSMLSIHHAASGRLINNEMS
jgi:hypothetical protein